MKIDLFFKKIMALHTLVGYKLHKYFIPRQVRIITDALKPEGISAMVIGANDGLSFDPIMKSLLGKVSSAVLIEPVPIYFKLLLKNLKNDNRFTFLNVAISDKVEKNLTMYYVKNTRDYSDESQGYASLDMDHLLKLGVKRQDIGYSDVEVIKINDTLKKHNINFLQIDTEGHDHDIIQSIDFTSNYLPRIIKFEILHMTFWQFAHLRIKLRKHDYHVYNFSNKDALAINYNS